MEECRFEALTHWLIFSELEVSAWIQIKSQGSPAFFLWRHECTKCHGNLSGCCWVIWKPQISTCWWFVNQGITKSVGFVPCGSCMSVAYTISCQILWPKTLKCSCFILIFTACLYSLTLLSQWATNRPTLIDRKLTVTGWNNVEQKSYSALISRLSLWLFVWPLWRSETWELSKHRGVVNLNVSLNFLFSEHTHVMFKFSNYCVTKFLCEFDWLSGKNARNGHSDRTLCSVVRVIIQAVW